MADKKVEELKRIKKYIATFEVTDRDLEEHTPERLRKIVEERSNYEFPDGTHIRLIHLGKGETDFDITDEKIMNNELAQMLTFWGVVPKDIESNVGTIWFTDIKTGKQHFITIGDCEADYKADGVERVS